MVMPMTTEVMTIAHCTPLSPNFSTIFRAMRWAAPASPMTRPIMAPRPITTSVDDICPPIPFSMSSGTAGSPAGSSL